MKIYGISNCDTVRKARKFLENKQCDFEFIDFRKDGLSIETVQEWLKFADFSVVVNKRSTSWRGLDDSQKALLSFDTATDDALALLVEQPTLIKRPVLQTGDTVLFGFKEAEYQQII